MSFRVWALGILAFAGCGGGQSRLPAESPEVAAVRSFYQADRAGQSTGLPVDSAWTRVAGHLSASLSALITAAQAVQAKCLADHPDEKPPWVEGDMFSSNFEGWTRVGTIVPGDSAAGRRAVKVSFEYEDRGETVRWDDRVMLIDEGGRWVIDDVIYGRTEGFSNGFGSGLRQALAPGGGC